MEKRFLETFTVMIHDNVHNNSIYRPLTINRTSRLSRMAKNRRQGVIENDSTSDFAILNDLHESREKST